MPVKKHTKKRGLSMEVSIGGVTLTDKAAFAKHLAVMVTSGLTITEALDIAIDAARGKLKHVLVTVHQSVEQGASLSVAFASHPKVFSKLFIDVVQAGEQSGTLGQNLSYIADQLEKQQALHRKVKSAMAYPSVVLVASTLLALGLSYYVLPQIIPLFNGLRVDLPLSTRMVIAFADYMEVYGLQTLLGFVIGIPTLIAILRSSTLRPITHFLILHIPVVKQISMNSNLSRFSLTLGTLLKSGLTITEALDIAGSTVSNAYYQKKIVGLARDVENGTSLSVAMAADPRVFPKLITSMIKVGESSGKLDDVLTYLAHFYEEEVDTATKTLTTMLEPLLLIIIGVVVATLASAIIGPIYRITGNVR